MINVQAVSKDYRINGKEPLRALSDINLEINKGDFVTVTGPSGSGKSTLLFTIGGMLAPTHGTVTFDGADLYSLGQSEISRLRRTRIGFIFQTFNLFPYLTSRENAALPAIINGTPKADACSRAEEMLVRIGLGSRLDHRPPKLSVGERQRVAIARGMINGPDILLADEPTGNLDPAAARDLMDLFMELNEKGQTIVMVTHDPHCAEAGRRLVKIRNGAIEEDTSINEEAGV
ncbi:MAG: hypothetical protein A2W19_04520 [Spirochaetes bacterium RBG_16_49_21]|nr:MAG: hypothetical protein A2W19_04520 [Spirochaetes bacterium RBG_16_49_21]